jgi:hypothetical protein
VEIRSLEAKCRGGELNIKELMKSDKFKSLRLAEQIYLIINRTPISNGERTFQIGSRLSAEMSENIIKLLKELGGLYQKGQTEEITFGEPTWFITIEDSKM